MAGSWAGLHDLPVRPAPSRLAAGSMVAAGRAVGPDEYLCLIRPGITSGSVT